MPLAFKYMGEGHKFGFISAEMSQSQFFFEDRVESINITLFWLRLLDTGLQLTSLACLVFYLAICSLVTAKHSHYNESCHKSKGFHGLHFLNMILLAETHPSRSNQPLASPTLQTSEIGQSHQQSSGGVDCPKHTGSEKSMLERMSF